MSNNVILLACDGLQYSSAYHILYPLTVIFTVFTFFMLYRNS